MSHSEQSEHVAASPRPRRRKWLILCLLVLTLLGGGYFALTHMARRDLEDAQAELDRLDPGWRLEDLDAKRVVLPPEQNSASQVKTVLALLGKGYLPVYPKIPPDVQLSEAQRKTLEKKLAKVAAALAEARKLKDMPRGQALMRLDAKGLPEEEPAIEVLAVARLLEGDVELAAQNKDGDAALASCRAILNVGRSRGDDPSLISFMVRVAARAICVIKVERTLAQTEPSPAALRDCQALMETEDAQPLVRAAVRRERAIIDHNVAALQHGDADDPGFADKWDPHSVRIKYFPGAFVQDRAAALRFMTEMAQAAKLPEHEQWLRFCELAQRPDRGEFIGIIPNYFIQDFGELARFRCAMTALAAERYRRQHGRWPESWAALIQGGFLKKEPLDPFDGKPLRWRLHAEGFLVYSIGPDGKDDGGKINLLNRRAGADLGFQLWNVPSRRKPSTEAAPAASPKAS